MSVDYIVASLPALRFGEPPPLGWEKFLGLIAPITVEELLADWRERETEMRNAMAEARGGAKYVRPVEGCSLYWKNRVTAAFAEKDVAKRDELLDRVWWDAAGELTPCAAPLGKGALATYAVRLQIALRRAKISVEAGNAAFDRLTASTKLEL